MKQSQSEKVQVERRAFRVAEFCEAYRVSRATTYKLMKAGKLKTVLIAGRRLIPIEAAEALLREGCK